MLEHEKIEDVLVDSDLAKQLVPNKFKFTSHQGRIRRQKLLLGAKEMSEIKPVNEVTLADICEKANIPRASAYHFFPNVEAVYLALRFLNTIELLENLNDVKTDSYDRWQGYLTGLIGRISAVMNENKCMAKLIYEVNTPDFEGESHGKMVDYQVSKLIYDNLSTKYEMPEYHIIEDVLLIAYSLTSSVFTLSYRKHSEITDHYRQEAIIACIAYLRCYLPEKLATRDEI